MLPLVALLDYWNQRRLVPSPMIKKYGKPYLNLHSYEVDELCQWVYNTRESGLNLGDELVNTSKFLESFVYIIMSHAVEQLL